MQVEGFLEELSIVPNYKINNRLLDFDLKLLVAKLEARNEISLCDLVSTIVPEEKKRVEIMPQVKANPKRELILLLMSALRSKQASILETKQLSCLLLYYSLPGIRHQSLIEMPSKPNT